jgi:hypothetical protein
MFAPPVLLNVGTGPTAPSTIQYVTSPYPKFFGSLISAIVFCQRFSGVSCPGPACSTSSCCTENPCLPDTVMSYALRCAQTRPNREAWFAPVKDEIMIASQLVAEKHDQRSIGVQKLTREGQAVVIAVQPDPFRCCSRRVHTDTCKDTDSQTHTDTHTQPVSAGSQARRKCQQAPSWDVPSPSVCSLHTIPLKYPETAMLRNIVYAPLLIYGVTMPLVP